MNREAKIGAGVAGVLLFLLIALGIHGCNKPDEQRGVPIYFVPRDGERDRDEIRRTDAMRHEVENWK